MKKILLLIACMLVWSPWASAQEKAPALVVYGGGTAFDGDIAFGYRWVTNEGNTRAGEYEYLHSSLGGQAVIEYDPLPHRLLLETYFNNTHDYFNELDYSYRDVVMLNYTGRRMYHNLDHLSIGADDPATPSPSMTDFDPNAEYFSDTALNRVQLRLKTPDFPFHLYLEAKNQEKHGSIQQRFMRSFSSGFSKASQTRDIDYETSEAKATMNSHLGPLEVEISHAVKEFGNTRDKSMTDATAVTYTHNQVSDTESSVDTVKVHTSHTGRISAAVTYSAGERKNKDSNVKTEFVNAAGDFTWIPRKEVTFSLKYRHYEVTPDAPTTVSSVSLAGLTTYSVKDPIGYTKDIMSALVRYRATDALTLRAEFAYDDLTRDFTPGAWLLDENITRTTARLGASYQLTRRIVMRGDVTHVTANVPEDSVDNTYSDTVDMGRLSLTWMPKPWYNLFIAGATIREKRDELAAPFTGERETQRDRAQASMTFLINKQTAVIPGYSYYQNKQNTSVAYTDTAGGIMNEGGVPYADTSHIASLAVTHSASESISVTVDALRSWNRGDWRNAGVVPGSTGLPELTNLHVIDSELGAEVRVRVTKNVGTDFRYRFRRLDDLIDDAEDGKYQTLFAGLTVAW